MNLDELTLCWLAGLFEGEAYFAAISELGRKYPYIALNMTDEEVVARVAALFSHGYTPFYRQKANWNIIYVFTLKGRPAAQLMKQLYPLMGQRRREKIDRSLEHYVFKEHRNLPTPKITEDQVRAIRKHIAAGETAKSIAQDFPISHYAVWDIRSGKTWAHVALETPKVSPETEFQSPPLTLDTDQKKLYWIAGLLEAEGSFMAGALSEPNRPRIALPMTHKDVVARAADILGVKYNALRSRNPRHKIVFRAMVRGRQAVAQMKQLFPLMGQRRQAQIAKALNSYTEIPISQGEHNPSAKISEGQAREIKARLLNNENMERIAHDFGISFSIVREIKYGRTWKHIMV